MTTYHSPNKKLVRVGSVAQAIDAASPTELNHHRVPLKRKVIESPTDIPDSYLTWDNYITSQDRFSKGYKLNLLRYQHILRKILLSRNFMPSSNSGILEIRESFECLLTSINGPYNGLLETMSALPANEARNIKTSNDKLSSFLASWNPNLSAPTTEFLHKQPTKDAIRLLDAGIEELSLNRSRQLEAEKIRAKQQELAEVLKNHLGNADVNVYGNLTVNNRKHDSSEQLSDHAITQLSSVVFKILSSTPAAIIPLVKANPTFFKSYLPDLRKVQNSFSLNATLVASHKDVSEQSLFDEVVNESSPNGTSNNDSFVPFKCYQCMITFDNKEQFLLHMKEHEPVQRSITDSFHETTFSMVTPTEKKMNCFDAIKLFRQGCNTCPPAILWSKRSRINKRIYGKMKVLDDIYVNIGHITYMNNYESVSLSDFKK
jgi:hypothetical protein